MADAYTAQGHFTPGWASGGSAAGIGGAADSVDHGQYSEARPEFATLLHVDIISERIYIHIVSR